MHAARRIALLLAAACVLAATLAAGPARADATGGARGVAVVAGGDATAPAAALARTVYADPGLLPPGLDEARARVLVGGPVPADAPHEVRDLAETRAAIHGDDAPSRSLLASLAASLHLRGLVVVDGQPGGRASARVFVASTGAFDPVLYEPDPAAVVTWGNGAAPVAWAGATLALHRAFAEAAQPALAPAPLSALAPATPVEGAEKPAGSRPFYTSPWFWGAIGAAAFAGAAFFFATRDTSSPNIALSVQVPK